MPISRQKKEEIVARLDEAVGNASTVVFANFHGLDVSRTQEMRNALKKQGVGYMVAKKTLINRVLNAANVSGEKPAMDGEIALVYGEDALAPARELYTFQKEFDGAVRIVGGIFEGAYVDGSQMTDIASIPSQEVLYSKLAFLLQSPVQRFAIALNQVADTKS